MRLKTFPESIQDGTYKYQIEKLRNLKNNGEEENASKLKQSLPAFTVSSTFTSKRKLEFVQDYNGVFILIMIRSMTLISIKSK